MVTDSIADYLTRIRNAQQAKHITEILYDQGFILKYKFDSDAGKHGTIKIAIKYDSKTKEPVIKKLGRISKPGLRKYVKSEDIPRAINGLGINIVSTSRGVMTDKQAIKENVGGELICYVH